MSVRPVCIIIFNILKQYQHRQKKQVLFYKSFQDLTSNTKKELISALYSVYHSV